MKNKANSYVDNVEKQCVKINYTIVLKTKTPFLHGVFRKKTAFFRLFRLFLCQLFGFALYLALMAELFNSAH